MVARLVPAVDHRAAVSGFNLCPRKLDVEYPQVWFQKNPGKKPPVIIPRIKDPNGLLGRAVFQLLKTQELPSMMVRAYLYHQLKDVSEICPDDWTSFGVQIGRKGARVHMFDMLDITEEDYNPGVLEGADEPRHEVLIGTILCMWQIGILSGGVYDNENTLHLQKRFVEVYGCDPVVSLAQGWQMFIEWKTDRELMKMIAAIDMYLNRFQTSPVSHYRLGTKACRYRDCTALKSIFSVVKARGLKSAGELLGWIWVKSLIEDVERMYQEDLAEADSLYSYFPYFMSFGLSKRSPYSVSANPGLHAFCQMINIASGDIRAVNARLVMPSCVHDILNNAVKVSYALSTGVRRNVVGATEAVDKAKQGLVDRREEPRSTNPLDWFVFFKKGGKQGENLKAFKERVRESITETRRGSLGEYVKNYLTLSIITCP